MKFGVIKSAFILSAFPVILGMPLAANANGWPSRPIKLVVCFPPGNAADVMARAVAPLLSSKLNQPVVVENKAGAGGMIGVESVIRASDEHTFGVCSLSPLTILPAVRKSMPYDVVKDVAPIVLSNTGPMVLLVNKKSPLNSMEDFIRYAKANPGKLTYASLGPGTISQMSMAAFKLATQTELVEIGYKGSGQALTDLIAGHVDVMLDGAASASTQIAAGTLKALAVTTEKRVTLLPQVPTMRESNISGLSAFNYFGWVGFFAPAKTAPEVIKKLNQDISDILKSKQVQERALVTGQEIPAQNSPEQFRQFMKDDYVRWSHIAKQIKLEIKD